MFPTFSGCDGGPIGSPATRESPAGLSLRKGQRVNLSDVKLCYLFKRTGEFISCLSQRRTQFSHFHSFPHPSIHPSLWGVCSKLHFTPTSCCNEHSWSLEMVLNSTGLRLHNRVSREIQKSWLIQNRGPDWMEVIQGSGRNMLKEEA